MLQTSNSADMDASRTKVLILDTIAAVLIRLDDRRGRLGPLLNLCSS